MTEFAEFFQALWESERQNGAEPFPWQVMLAKQAVAGDWPECIDLPTASGKTACLDVAVYALARTADKSPSEGRMPRRVWLVVDRRIVVDEAYERAREMCHKLADAKNGPLKDVADQLRLLSAGGRPLAVARLRGGTWRSDVWARSPVQPTIICSTVDQLGSALLFRAYGHGDRSASIYAGLAANDSLILLDEAHCAVPFMQTLRAIARYRERVWASAPLETPFRFSIMSATPPAGTSAHVIFPRPEERDQALNDQRLQQRLKAKKWALLEAPVTDEEFAAKAAGLASQFIDEEKTRIAVMVNRVASAGQISEQLRTAAGDKADIVLLTGRMRPLDRDSILEKWKPVLKAGSKEAPARPVVVVTTQCLEVGADFSFDALVTECASLDALRQRFGRLDRLGQACESRAAILIRERDASPEKNYEGDPIYGHALRNTWQWLNEQADATAPVATKTAKKSGAKSKDPSKHSGRPQVDFGFAALDTKVRMLRREDEERHRSLLAPTSDAPVLMPAYMDLFCQTSPRPVPDPEIELFLHGKDRGEAEAHVVLRADLPECPDQAAEDLCIEIVSLVPPTTPETFTVPLHRLRRWLAKKGGEDTGGDVEGVPEAAEDDESRPKRNHSGPQGAACRPFLVWRGLEHSTVLKNTNELRPGDVVVLSTSELPNDLDSLVQTPALGGGFGKHGNDVAERAFYIARRRPVLRLNPQLLASISCNAELLALLAAAESEEKDRDEIETALKAFAESEPASPEVAEDQFTALEWLRKNARALSGNFRLYPHPSGGAVLVGKQMDTQEDAAAEVEADSIADEGDLTSKAAKLVWLDQHTADFSKIVAEFAGNCLNATLRESTVWAAQYHDAGKLDPRFQLVLWGGDELEWAAAEGPLAKSSRIPETRHAREKLWRVAGLPKGWRHEFLSLHLAQRYAPLPPEGTDSDLALHLIGSHHGYARPFAPLAPDTTITDADDVCLTPIGITAVLTAKERQQMHVRMPDGADSSAAKLDDGGYELPAYRLGSGVADRFWRLTRRYGWWGLAYLEAIFRLADWQASENPFGAAVEQSPSKPASKRSCTARLHSLALDAVDGANPLGFLVALGTLRTLTKAWPNDEPRMEWQLTGSFWRPMIVSASLPSIGVEARRCVVQALAKTLRLGTHPDEISDADACKAEELFKAAKRKLADRNKEIARRGLRGEARDEARRAECGSLEDELLRCREEWITKLQLSAPSLEMCLGLTVQVPMQQFQEVVELALQRNDLWAIEMLAHFASDACLDRKKGLVEPTPFSFVNGSGQQWFLGTARELVRRSTVEKLVKALFESWVPEDDTLSMRWNPSEDRRYALMAEDPTATGNKPKTIWAANLLAYCGLGLLPSVPKKSGLHTASMRRWGGDTGFTWPIWKGALSAKSVTSVLTLKELAELCPPRRVLRDYGISAIFRSFRIRVGDGANYKLNFTAAQPV